MRCLHESNKKIIRVNNAATSNDLNVNEKFTGGLTSQVMASSLPWLGHTVMKHLCD